MPDRAARRSAVTFVINSLRRVELGLGFCGAATTPGDGHSLAVDKSLASQSVNLVGAS